MILRYVVPSYRIIISGSNWAITHGRFGINFYVSTMGRYNDEPSKWHIVAILRSFEDLKHNIKLGIISDTGFLKYQSDVGLEINWSKLYPDNTKKLTHGILNTKGKTLSITKFVDADSSHDIDNRSYVTGLLMILDPLHNTSVYQKK